MNDITRAILNVNHICVLSTLDENGAPWASPVHFASDDSNIYWVSNSQTNHSRNIDGDNRVFITIFDSHQNGDIPGEKGAIYCATNASELLGDDETFARSIYFEKYPDRNIEKFQEWSIYSAPIGEVDEVKTKDAMIYYNARQTA